MPTKPITKRTGIDPQAKIDNPFSCLKISKINNRRYLGNKYKLTPFIKKIVEQVCPNVNTIADVFSGTGAVASAFTDKMIITNDLLFSNYVANVAWFSAEEYSVEKVKNYILFYNSITTDEDNYMRRNFADTFFSAEDCSKIGFIREHIEKQKQYGVINEKEWAILITSLLYAMDKIANTCGHYDAYRKQASFDKKLEMTLLAPNKNLNKNNMCFNQDANELVKKIEVDLVYLDPPYNSRQYCDAYHLIENVARWNKTPVYGVARKMERQNLKSDYCTKEATAVFEDLVKNINAKYILLSYNNMGEKGHGRSNAKIKDDDILRILNKKGEVTVFSEDHRAFTTGKSNIADNQERLFFCKCKDYQKNVIASPLNYIGGKFKLLPQLLKLFPEEIDVALDMFCGGCNVGLNLNSSRVIFNDNNEDLIGIFNTFKSLGKDKVFEKIFEVINEYGLSESSLKGYAYYGCESSGGLASFNRDKYLKLRKDFNSMVEKNFLYYIKLYVLIIYAFNNQIRFNNNGFFNLPVGKRDFNDKIKSKLSLFLDRVISNDYTFCSHDFRNIDTSFLSKDSFVYADPPYLITCATYNEKDGWNEKDEKDLLKLLDELNNNKVRFALSNVLESKGKKNTILSEWLDNRHYLVHYLDFNYKNSNYQVKDKTQKTVEVLITNYKTNS